ncbi:Exosome complex component RRP45 [Kappamyces sp. JEL0829]|nr:Exosome complex component RRP45 [Kappamyces sp. JEL0829]
MRSIKINLGPDVGTAVVQLGKTRVLASVSCDIVRPSPASPSEGSISINTEFSPMAFPASDGDKKSEEEVVLSRMLEKTLRKSRAIDTEGLCIISGEKVWAIRVDVRVLDHDGNVLDAACISTIAALLHFKRPDVTVSGLDVVVHPPEEKSLIALSIHHIPISITFGLYSNGDLHVADPCLEEELAQIGQLTFVVNMHKEICTMSYKGEFPLEPEKVLLCSSIAGSKAAEITALIKKAVAGSAQL